jgi:hypothetical protein
MTMGHFRTTLRRAAMMMLGLLGYIEVDGLVGL